GSDEFAIAAARAVACEDRAAGQTVGIWIRRTEADLRLPVPRFVAKRSAIPADTDFECQPGRRLEAVRYIDAGLNRPLLRRFGWTNGIACHLSQQKTGVRQPDVAATHGSGIQVRLGGLRRAEVVLSGDGIVGLAAVDRIFHFEARLI